MVDDIDFNVNIIMDMGEMTHSSPNYEIVKEGDYFRKDLVFIMPSNDSQKWIMTVTLMNDESLTNSYTFDVQQSERLQTFMYNEQMHFVSLTNLNSPIVGMNDIGISLHKRESMMSWPNVDNVNLEIEPWMPGMDHGSPNNVNPVFIEKGLYSGKVNFTMTGEWTVTVSIIENGNQIGQVVFPIVF